AARTTGFSSTASATRTARTAGVSSTADATRTAGAAGFSSTANATRTAGAAGFPGTTNATRTAGFSSTASFLAAVFIRCLFVSVRRVSPVLWVVLPAVALASTGFVDVLVVVLIEIVVVVDGH